jgi:hypothetical protein
MPHPVDTWHAEHGEFVYDGAILTEDEHVRVQHSPDPAAAYEALVAEAVAAEAAARREAAREAAARAAAQAAAEAEARKPTPEAAPQRKRWPRKVS